MTQMQYDRADRSKGVHFALRPVLGCSRLRLPMCRLARAAAQMYRLLCTSPPCHVVCMQMTGNCGRGSQAPPRTESPPISSPVGLLDDVARGTTPPRRCITRFLGVGQILGSPTPQPMRTRAVHAAASVFKANIAMPYGWRPCPTKTHRRTANIAELVSQYDDDYKRSILSMLH